MVEVKTINKKKVFKLTVSQGVNLFIFIVLVKLGYIF